jgi:hypothetical protein
VFAIMERVAVGVVTVLGVVVVAIGTKVRFRSRLLHIKNVQKCDERLLRDFCVFMSSSSSSILSSSILSSITLI